MFGNKIQEKTTIVGTGPYSVGSASNVIPGWKTWRSNPKFTNGAKVVTWAVNDDESIWELTRGNITLGPPDSISRTYILSSTGTLIDWQPGDIVYLYSAPAVEALEGGTTLNRAATRPWWVEFGLWLKTTTPAAGYEQITFQDGAGDSGDSAIGVVNTTNHDVTIYGLSPGHLYGLTLSRSSATVLGIAAGVAMDSTNVVGIKLASAFTKSTAGAWAAGSGQNGMGNALAIANNTWYHVFEILVNGVADVYFDTSVTAANKPAGTTHFRRIGRFKTDGSAQIINFVQDGDWFWLSTPVTDVNQNNPGTAAVTRTLSMIPTGESVIAILQLVVLSTDVTVNCSAYLSDLALADVAPGLITDTANATPAAGGVSSAGTRILVRTNASAQIRSRLSNSTSSIALLINTLGWIDRRGKDG